MTHLWSTCSLVVRSTQMSGTALAELIGADPRSSRDRGTLASPRNPQSMRHVDSVATIGSSAGGDASLEDHLRSIAEVVDGIDPSTWPADVTARVIIGAERALLAEDLTIPSAIVLFLTRAGGCLVIDAAQE